MPPPERTGVVHRRERQLLIVQLNPRNWPNEVTFPSPWIARRTEIPHINSETS